MSLLPTVEAACRDIGGSQLQSGAQRDFEQVLQQRRRNIGSSGGLIQQSPAALKNGCKQRPRIQHATVQCGIDPSQLLLALPSGCRQNLNDPGNKFRGLFPVNLKIKNRDKRKLVADSLVNVNSVKLDSNAGFMLTTGDIFIER